LAESSAGTAAVLKEFGRPISFCQDANGRIRLPVKTTTPVESNDRASG
jgi:hypothetical protein